jgi:ribonuclease D
MYFVGCVDLQDVFASYLREKNLYNSLDKISLSNAVKLTLGIELDKEYQLYPWINRPIDCKAMKYATTDSKVLLMLWNYLKSNIDINKISLNRSKEVMLIKYQFPVRKNCWIGDLANFMTHMKCESASIKSVIIDELNDRKELFRLLWLTRDECSRSVDRRSNIFMSVDELGCIFRFQPQTVESLLSLLPNLRQWDISISQKIISCILEFKNIVEERKIVEKRLPSATVTSNMEVDDEKLKTIKLKSRPCNLGSCIHIHSLRSELRCILGSHIPMCSFAENPPKPYLSRNFPDSNTNKTTLLHKQKV